MLGKRLAVMIGLMAGCLFLASTVSAKGQDEPPCTAVKIESFTNIATNKIPTGTSYQLSLVLSSDKDAITYISLSGDLGVQRRERSLPAGITAVFHFWFGAKDSFSAKAETVSIDSNCLNDPRPVTLKLRQQNQGMPTDKIWNIECPTVVVLDSRGSGEPSGYLSPPADRFVNALRRGVPSSYDYFDYSIMVVTNPYPALGGMLSMLSAKSRIPGNIYNLSVRAGEIWLKQEISDLAKYCKTTKIYLTGYSQGAQVTGNVYQTIEYTYRNVVGVVLFGDPRFTPYDSSAKIMADGSNYITNLTGSLPARKGFYSQRVLSFCHVHDPVCEWKWTDFARYRLSLHDTYAQTDEAQSAADYFNQLYPLE